MKHDEHLKHVELWIFGRGREVKQLLLRTMSIFLDETFPRPWIERSR
jgi:hypothetical protein